MSTIRKTVTVTDSQDDWIKAQIAAGGYTNDSEYFRDLIRREQLRQQNQEDLRQAIQAGLDSGISDLSVDEIWAAAEARVANENA